MLFVGSCSAGHPESPGSFQKNCSKDVTQTVRKQTIHAAISPTCSLLNQWCMQDLVDAGLRIEPVLQAHTNRWAPECSSSNNQRSVQDLVTTQEDADAAQSNAPMRELLEASTSEGEGPSTSDGDSIDSYHQCLANNRQTKSNNRSKRQVSFPWDVHQLVLSSCETNGA